MERIRKRCKTKSRRRLLSDGAKKLGVNQPAIFYALIKNQFSLRKKSFVIEKEIEKKGENIISFPSEFYQENWK